MNMKETCDLCIHKSVCKNIEEAYKLQDEVDMIDHSDIFCINVSCLKFYDNHHTGIKVPSIRPAHPLLPNKYANEEGDGMLC